MSAYEREVDMNMQSIMQTEQVSPAEAMAMALQRANQKSAKPQEEIAREYFGKMFEMLAEGADMADDPQAAMKAAETEAAAMTERFMGMDLGGYNGRSGQGGGTPKEQGGDQQTEIPAHDVQMLMDDPSKAAMFDEVYGQGAAEQVLNGG